MVFVVFYLLLGCLGPGDESHRGRYFLGWGCSCVRCCICRGGYLEVYYVLIWFFLRLRGLGALFLRSRFCWRRSRLSSWLQQSYCFELILVEKLIFFVRGQDKHFNIDRISYHRNLGKKIGNINPGNTILQLTYIFSSPSLNSDLNLKW